MVIYPIVSSVKSTPYLEHHSFTKLSTDSLAKVGEKLVLAKFKKSAYERANSFSDFEFTVLRYPRVLINTLHVQNNVTRVRTSVTLHVR